MKTKCLRMQVLYLCGLFLVFPSLAFAGTVIHSVTGIPDCVVPGQTLDITVTASTSGSQNNNDWNATEFSLDVCVGAWINGSCTWLIQGWYAQNDFYCAASPSISSNVTNYSQLYPGVTIPAFAGLGEVEFWVTAYRISDCTNTGDRFHKTVLVSESCAGTGNTAPVAEDDDFNVDEDAQLAGNVLADNGNGPDSDADDDPLTVTLGTDASNGILALGSDGTFTYVPDPDYCGPDSFTYTLNDGTDDSSEATASITVACINDEPDFTVVNPGVNEDSGPHSDVPVTSAFDPGATNESGQTVIDCILSNFSDPNSPAVITSAPSPSVNGSNDGCVISFDTAANNYGGNITFDLQIQDSGGTANVGDDDLSPVHQVTITVSPVNDAPYIESISDGQTVQYSDDIDTITVLVRDIDSDYQVLDLTRSGQPSALGDVIAGTPCQAWESGYTGTGGECTWTLDGQVLVPGVKDYPFDFTPGDGTDDGAPVTYTLGVVPEEAIVHLDNEGDANPVAIEVTDSDTDPTNQAFTMYFWAFEMNSQPFGDKADAGNANAVEDDFNHENVKGTITFSGVGPGPGHVQECTLITDVLSDGGDYSGYSDYMIFRCDIPAGSLGVNTYEVMAEVGGFAADEIYFAGFDEDAFVVYDPNAGYTTGGGWFYWPGTDLPEGAQFLPPGGEQGVDEIDDPCAPYYGDKTNFGYTMKYNKKGTKVQGSALVMRHPMLPVEIEPDVWACLEGDKYRVKSNALFGLAVGADDYGFASFAGKAVYREPGYDDEGNHTFFIYVEDHGEQGCNQDPSDRFWIEVWDRDDLTVMEPFMGQPAYEYAADVNCGNIVVPH